MRRVHRLLTAGIVGLAAVLGVAALSQTVSLGPDTSAPAATPAPATVTRSAAEVRAARELRQARADLRKALADRKNAASTPVKRPTVFRVVRAPQTASVSGGGEREHEYGEEHESEEDD